MKNLSIIACVSKDRGIGLNEKLIWRIPEDMQFFKQTTMGKTVVMGRKTFDSIGQPLPGRTNVVLSRSALDVPGVEWCTSKADLDKYLESQPGEKYIIGGFTLYQMYLDEAEKIYLTEVDESKPADTFFPDFDPAQFSRHLLQSGEQDDIKYNIVEYVRE